MKSFDECDVFASYLYRNKPYTREEHDQAARELRDLLQEYRNKILGDLLTELRNEQRWEALNEVDIFDRRPRYP